MKAILYPPGGGPVQRVEASADAVRKTAAQLGFKVLESADADATHAMPDGTLVRTEPVPGPVAQTALALIDFLFLFTQTERITLRKRRATDPLLDDFWTLLEAAGEVRLTHPSV